MSDVQEPTFRPTARLVVLDPEDRLLLFKIEDDTVSDPSDPRGANQHFSFWVVPGGGLEAGESFEDAAQRELREETGLVAELGPCLYEHHKLLLLNGQRVLFQERFFLARVATADVSLDGLNALEQAVYRGHRWWPLATLAASEETFFPEELLEIFRNAIAMSH